MNYVLLLITYEMNFRMSKFHDLHLDQKQLIIYLFLSRMIFDSYTVLALSDEAHKANTV